MESSPQTIESPHSLKKEEKKERKDDTESVLYNHCQIVLGLKKVIIFVYQKSLPHKQADINCDL